jgi:hypothetical protein
VCIEDAYLHAYGTAADYDAAMDAMEKEDSSPEETMASATSNQTLPTIPSPPQPPL